MAIRIPKSIGRRILFLGLVWLAAAMVWTLIGIVVVMPLMNLIEPRVFETCVGLSCREGQFILGHPGIMDIKRHYFNVLIAFFAVPVLFPIAEYYAVKRLDQHERIENETHNIG